MPLDESAEDEIRRFEEQFRRQPESLVFARLADAYRKAGDPHRALAVLEEGIRRHMDYLSAHIVRARTYRDLGRFEDARSAFGRVIEIDAENLVAIQGLAEVAREADDTAAEIAWLERLALADPQNPEPGARLEQLRRLVDRLTEPGPADGTVYFGRAGARSGRSRGIAGKGRNLVVREGGCGSGFTSDRGSDFRIGPCIRAVVWSTDHPGSRVRGGSRVCPGGRSRVRRGVGSRSP